MVDAILDKCQKGKNLSSLDYEKLLTLEDENKINQLLNSAKTIRDKYSKKVLLTPTLSIKDKTCEKLLACIKRSEELDIPRVNFFRQYETDEDVINACKLVKENKELGTVLAENLQGALPAIALDGHPALSTAYMNDCEPLLCFAQQVNGYGKEGDVFLGISTSGNSKNVLYAATTAHAKGMKVIELA